MEPNFEPAGTPVHPIQLLNQIMTGLRHRYASLNGVYYEAAWTDSWVHCRCYHKHLTLIDAAKCGMPQPGFYVLAVDSGSPRELSTEEDEIVNRFRFAGVAHPRTSTTL
jgi:hypothetical protein